MYDKHTKYVAKISRHTLFHSKNTKWWNYKEVTLLDASDEVIPIIIHMNDKNFLINWIVVGPKTENSWNTYF